jgi:hypothetical protein
MEYILDETMKQLHLVFMSSLRLYKSFCIKVSHGWYSDLGIQKCSCLLQELSQHM